MKRFLSLLSLLVVPTCSWAAAQEQRPESNSSRAEAIKGFCCTPVSPRDETWAARTDVGVVWGKVPYRLLPNHRSYTLYSLNTIQPLYRSDDLHQNLFVFGGLGTTKWKNSSWNVGLGYRYLTASADNLFGIGISQHRMKLNRLRFHGPAAFVNWSSLYTDLSLSRAWNRFGVHGCGSKVRSEMTSVDLGVQLPYLPWTKLSLGRTWFGDKFGRRCFHSYRGASLKRLDYGLKFNLLGCLSLEGGYLGGWGRNSFVRLVLSLGRPASAEYALTDGLLGNEAFTPRDLKNITSVPVRNTIDTIAQIK